MAAPLNICSICPDMLSNTSFEQCNLCGTISHTTCLGTNVQIHDGICTSCYSFPFHSVTDPDDFVYERHFNVSDISSSTRSLRRLNIQESHSTAGLDNPDLDPDVNFFQVFHKLDSSYLTQSKLNSFLNFQINLP